MSNAEFNAESFLHTQYTEENSTVRLPLIEGEYRGLITKVAAAMTKNGTPKLDVSWEIDHAELADEVGRDKTTIRQTVWLDFNDAGNLDFGSGKNLQLGRLREAVGQNVAGDPWSPKNLEGEMATVRVKHRVDANDAEVIYEDIRSVTAL